MKLEKIMKPELNRRTFVTTLVTSLTAPATTAALSVPIESLTEHPELIAMGDRLPDVLQSYRDAASEVSSIAEKWEPRWPTPDPEIIWYANGSKRHADILGRGIKTEWGIKRHHASAERWNA